MEVPFRSNASFYCVSFQLVIAVIVCSDDRCFADVTGDKVSWASIDRSPIINNAKRATHFIVRNLNENRTISEFEF